MDKTFYERNWITWVFYCDDQSFKIVQQESRNMPRRAIGEWIPENGPAEQIDTATVKSLAFSTVNNLWRGLVGGTIIAITCMSGKRYTLRRYSNQSEETHSYFIYHSSLCDAASRKWRSPLPSPFYLSYLAPSCPSTLCQKVHQRLFEIIESIAVMSASTITRVRWQGFKRRIHSRRDYSEDQMRIEWQARAKIESNEEREKLTANATMTLIGAAIAEVWLC